MFSTPSPSFTLPQGVFHNFSRFYSFSFLVAHLPSLFRIQQNQILVNTTCFFFFFFFFLHLFPWHRSPPLTALSSRPFDVHNASLFFSISLPPPRCGCPARPSEPENRNSPPKPADTSFFSEFRLLFSFFFRVSIFPYGDIFPLPLSCWLAASLVHLELPHLTFKNLSPFLFHPPGERILLPQIAGSPLPPSQSHPRSLSHNKPHVHFFLVAKVLHCPSPTSFTQFFSPPPFCSPNCHSPAKANPARFGLRPGCPIRVPTQNSPPSCSCGRLPQPPTTTKPLHPGGSPSTLL